MLSMKRHGVGQQRKVNGAPLPFTVSVVSHTHRKVSPKAQTTSRAIAINRLLLQLQLIYQRNPRAPVVVGVALFIVLITLLQHAGNAGLPTAEMSSCPRYMRYIYDDSLIRSPLAQRLDVNVEIYPSKRTVYFSKNTQKAFQHMQDSKDYKSNQAEPFETDECKAQYHWQKISLPTCNLIHEADFTNLAAPGQVRLIAHGYFRDVWTVPDSEKRHVLKTLRFTHDFLARHYDRHRRDAMAMERLTRSPHVLDIYGYCGNSGLNEFADGGDLTKVIWPATEGEKNVTAIMKLDIATQVAVAIADMHNIDKEGQASMAHTDITPGQFVWNGHMYKLNDFNRARFLRWNTTGDKPCGYLVGNNPGKNRSPEEYNYQLQSEKVDIYSMGNIFYMLLSNLWPFIEIEEKEARMKVKSGNRPKLPEEVRDSKDPIIQTLKEAMVMCHEQDPEKRATARQVETFLRKKLMDVRPDAMSKWGLSQ